MRLVRQLALLTSTAMALCSIEAVAADADDEILVLGTREQGYRATVAPTVNKSDTRSRRLPIRCRSSPAN